MKKIVLWLMSTLTVVVLALGYHTSTGGGTVAAAGTSIHSGTGTGTGTSGTGTGGSGTSGSTGTSSGTGTTSGSSTGSTTQTSGKTYTGSAVSTRYGDVQVQITVSNGKVTSAEAVEYPTESHRDQEINAQAIPVLNQEASQATSASIDAVSGATYTSEGYTQSLQSALDQAGIA